MLNFNEEIAVMTTKLSRLDFERQSLEKEIKRLTGETDALKLEEFNAAAVWLKELSQNQKAEVSKMLAGLGTLALQYSMGTNYEMEIETSGSAKRPEARVFLVKNSNRENREDPLEDNGGGIVDIMGTSLQLVILDSYNDPVIDGPVIFDEPFKMVSKEYVPMLSEFMSKLPADFNRQIIVVTHNEFLASMTESNVYVSLGEDERSRIDVKFQESREE